MTDLDFSSQATEVDPSKLDFSQYGTPVDAATPAAPPMPLGDQAKRSFAMAAHNIGAGLASVPDIVLGPATYLGNKALEAAGVSPQYRFGTAGQAAETALGAAGVPNPEPVTAAERYAGAGERALSGAFGGVGAGKVLATSASPVTSYLGTLLAENPGAQAKAALTSAGAAETTKELGGSPLAQLAAAFAGGVAPSAAAGTGAALRAAASKVLPASEGAQQLAQQAEQFGIPLKATQVADSKIGKYVDSATGLVPFSGAGKFDVAQRTAFNRAVADTIGQKADAITPQVFAKAKADTGAIYDDLLSRNNLQITPDLEQRFAAIQDEARAYSPAVRAQIDENIQRIRDNAQNGMVPGARVKVIDSGLGRASATGGEGAGLVGDLQDAIREGLNTGMSGADQALLQRANGQWRNIKTIEPLVAQASAQDGLISPNALLNRVAANQAGKASLATGTRGDLGTLAQIGKRFIGEPPNSGTATREAVNKGLGAIGNIGTGLLAGHFVSPLTGLATAAGAIGGARGVQSMFQNPDLVRRIAGLPTNNSALMSLLLQQRALPAATVGQQAMAQPQP
jgi:hypothetical protein